MIIEIVPPRPQWPAEFAAIAARLAVALEHLAPRIDHIGSTAVPGLPAKDVIDIQIAVASLGARAEIAEALRAAGFVVRDDIAADHVPACAAPEPDQWAKLYAQAPAGARPAHIHMRRIGAANARYARLFRDYLRASPAAAASYAAIKRELAARHADDADAYYAVKDPVCDLIIAAAEYWAMATGWDGAD
jgi:GrpB-like predicted nucleotidyltransferase (UPF0157 family)